MVSAKVDDERTQAARTSLWEPRDDVSGALQPHMHNLLLHRYVSRNSIDFYIPVVANKMDSHAYPYSNNATDKLPSTLGKRYTAGLYAWDSLAMVHYGLETLFIQYISFHTLKTRSRSTIRQLSSLKAAWARPSIFLAWMHPYTPAWRYGSQIIRTQASSISFREVEKPNSLEYIESLWRHGLYYSCGLISFKAVQSGNQATKTFCPFQ